MAFEALLTVLYRLYKTETKNDDLKFNGLILCDNKRNKYETVKRLIEREQSVFDVLCRLYNHC